MESQPRSADWRSILLLIFSLGGTVLTISAAISMLILMALSKSILLDVNPSPLATTLTASTLIAIGLLLLPVAWLSLKRLRGQEFRILRFSSLPPWVWIVTPILWLSVLTLATLFYDAPGSSWYAPVLHFLSIAVPLYIVVRVAVNRIPLGSSQRIWAVFGSGITLSPVLAIIVETIIIGFGVLIAAIYLGLNPENLQKVERLINQLENAPDLESMILLVGPILNNPLTLLAALVFLSIIVPVVEEIAKSLGIWLVADRLVSPGQGFAMGVLSGAGFALAESLSASLTADETWGITLGVRAISGSMHILATGLIGWGIAYARLEKRYLRLAGMTILAILLHSVWNAGAVFSVAGGLRIMLSMPDFDVLGTLMTVGGIGLIFVLTGSMVFAFFVINQRLQTPPPDQQEMGEEPALSLSGEQDGGVK